ncbi:Kinetochore Spc25 [Gossypium arboreum]|uniref:Kinetochore Spc25 n=1 Tax=Gossypium arboreum TaxID=29729 RepID=A0A0B0PKV8_GOSAR|nr:Kinetochore Spc25 [Gossypium arboreum]
MWRRNAFQENPDSDQSISDEDDFDDDFRENCASLGDRLEKEKEKNVITIARTIKNTLVFVLKRMLKCLTLPMRATASPLRSFLGQENVMRSKTFIASGAKESDHSYGIKDGNGENAWSMVTKEAEALINLDKNVSSFSSASKADKSCKGAKSKIKPRFSFCFQSHKGRSATSDNENEVSTKAGEMPERLKASDHGTLEHSIAEVLEDFNGEEENRLEIVPADVEAHGHGFIEHSMAELLDDLQDNTSLLRGNFKMHSRARGKRVQAALKRSICSLGDRTIESEDLNEPFSGGSSSNDEADYQNLKLAIPEIKKPTISDKFQEALGATSLTAEGTFIPRPGAFSTGLFGKLQQIMQQEKETDTHFLMKLQNGASFKNEPSCIAVNIVSRYLDAKLTVCYCSFVKTIEGILQSESPKILENEGQKVTVIFNQRICANVDLEIGKLICIHAPWKEVDVTGDGEKTILSTYFSDISL